MANTGGLNGRDLWAGRRNPGDFVADPLDTAQLVEKQVAQGHINGGDVDYPLEEHQAILFLSPLYSNCSHLRYSNLLLWHF